MIYFDSVPPQSTIKTPSKPYQISITVILLKLHFVKVRQGKLINFVSLRIAKSCMTDLLHLFDKVLIKAPIKMHSMPSNTRHTAFYLDMQFVKLRQTKSTVLSCYVLQDRHKFRDTKDSFFVIQLTY